MNGTEIGEFNGRNRALIYVPVAEEGSTRGAHHRQRRCESSMGSGAQLSELLRTRTTSPIGVFDQAVIS